MAPSPPALPTADAALALIKPAVRALAAYSLRAPDAPRKLNQNESPYDVPDSLKDAVLARMRAAAWNRYPAFTPRDLQCRIADRHGWVPEGVLVGNGSNELIEATLAVTVGAGSAVVTPVPTFALYPLLTQVFGGRHVGVPFDVDFRFDIGALVGAARSSGARVVVVNAPNNPTGSALPDGAIERVLAETDALVVVDEAYQDFGGSTAVPLLALHPRLVVLRTFSKAMSLAGLRFGYALAHPALAREIAKAKLPYNVNHFTLVAATAALEHPEAFAQATERVRSARDRLFAGLRQIGGMRAFPSAANFVLIRCEALPAAEVFQRLVDDHGILVRDVSGGAHLEGCLRITAGTPDDVAAVLGALQAIFAVRGGRDDSAR